MAVRFLFGRAGSGKTHHCLQAIREQLQVDPVNGPSLILFIPEQATVQAERMLLSTPGLRGASRYYTMSFRRLQQMVLGDTGFADREVIGPIGRQMILQYLLLRHRKDLEVFSKVADRPGTAAKVASGIVEFMEEGILPQHLRSMTQQLGPTSAPSSARAGDPQGLLFSDLRPAVHDRRPTTNEAALRAVVPSLLAGKLHDLGRIYEAYLAWLTEGQQADPAGLLAQVADKLDQCSWLRGANIWVDGFAGFSAQQRYALVRLAQVAGHMDIGLLMDPSLAANECPPEPYDLFYRTWQTCQQLHQAFLEANIEIEEPLLLQPAPLPRFGGVPLLGHIESQVFATTASPAAPSSGTQPEIDVVAAPNRQGEIEAVARKIVDLTRAAPKAKAVRYRQIAILVRDLEPYHDYIHTIFAAHGIPCFIDKRRSVSHHPLVELVRALLRLIAEDWPIDAVASLLKTGLVPIPRDRADLVENYLLAHGIEGWGNWCGKPWQYLRRLVGADEDPLPASPQEQDILRKANHARRVMAAILTAWAETRKASTCTGRQWAEHLYGVLERLKVPGCLMRWQRLARLHGSHESLEHGQQHKQVWSLLSQLLDDLVAGLGEEAMTAEQFRSTIEAGLEAFSLPLIPPVVDQVVVGSVDRSRQPDIAVAFVVGFNEGLFPHRAGQDVLFGDQERDVLSQVGGMRDLMTGRQRLFDERLLAYIALTRASRYVWLSYATADETGKQLLPSPYLRALKASVPSLSTRELRDPLANLDISQVGTAWQAATTAVLAARALCNGGTDAVAQGTEARSQETGDRRRKADRETENRGQNFEAETAGLRALSAPDARLLSRRELVAVSSSVPVLAGRLHRIASACDYTNECTIRPEQAAQLFGEELNCSVSQLQEYAVCPYRYFAHYGLRLKERQEFELAAVELGSFYHRILYKVATQVRQKGHSLRTVPHEILSTILSQTADEEIRAVVQELALTGGKEAYLLDRCKVDIATALRGHLALWKQSSFDPLSLEAGFGVKDGLPPLEIRTPKGRCAVLRGKIDRIDIASPAGRDVLAVIDYKRSSHYKLNLDHALAGLQVQLIVYMKAAIEAGTKPGTTAPMPGGMYYFNLLPTWQKVSPGELVDPAVTADNRPWQLKGFTNSDCLSAFHNDDDQNNNWPVEVRLKKDGTPDARSAAAGTEDFRRIIDYVWQSLGQTVDRIAEGEFPATPYKAGKEMPCPFCAFGEVCRFSPQFNQCRTIARSGSVKKCLEIINMEDHGQTILPT